MLMACLDIVQQERRVGLFSVWFSVFRWAGEGEWGPMSKLAIALTLAALLSGCAHESYAASEAGKATALGAWSGKDVSLFIQGMGPPDKTFQMPNGDALYSWFRLGPETKSAGIYYGGVMSASATQTQCTITVTATPDALVRVIAVDGNGGCRIPNAPGLRTVAQRPPQGFWE